MEQSLDRQRRPLPLSMNLVDWAGVLASVDGAALAEPGSGMDRASTRGDD
jgi:hypothetical protein